MAQNSTAVPGAALANVGSAVGATSLACCVNTGNGTLQVASSAGGPSQFLQPGASASLVLPSGASLQAATVVGSAPAGGQQLTYSIGTLA